MDSSPINPGRVDWSGDNSGIYLKASEDGPYVTLASLFRIVLPPHGRGHALVLVEASDRTSSREPINVCLTDNEPLARWLVCDFARHFQQFRGVLRAESLRYRPITVRAAGGDGVELHTEHVAGDDVAIDLTWRGLGEPFMVQMPRALSATGRHEMFSLFVDAREAEVVVNGRRLEGRVYPRDYAGRSSTTAFLAFSETWVRA